MKSRLLIFMRLAQAACGLAVLSLALWIWWRMFLWPPTYGRKFDSDDALFCLMMVGPALFVAVGALLQARYRWLWACALVLLGSAAAAYMGVGARFLFLYFGRRSSLPAIYLYLILLAVVVSLVNAIHQAMAKLAQRVSDTRAEQILGRERRERVL